MENATLLPLQAIGFESCARLEGGMRKNPRFPKSFVSVYAEPMAGTSADTEPEVETEVIDADLDNDEPSV